MISSFLGDGCWHPGLSLPLVYLPLLAVAVSSKFHWSVPFMLRPARLLWWVVAAVGPSSEHQCQLYIWHTPAWWSYRFCVAPPTCCIFCLAWWVVYVALLLCSCHHLHCSVRFHPLLLVSLLQSLWFGLQDFHLENSSLLNGLPAILWDPLLPLSLLCSKKGLAGLLVGYLKLLPLCIDVFRTFQRLVFSIRSYLELISQL